MKRALILGGTRYVGKRLVQLLADSGAAVTVATRGRTPFTFTGDVKHVRLDRSSAESMNAALAHGEWDVVYDQLCYSPVDAAIGVEALKGRAGRYILCSTGLVYGTGTNCKESAFDASTYPIKPAEGRNWDYGEGKRLAEAVLFQTGTFSAVSVRFPIILGPDDYTERLRVGVRRVVRGQNLQIENPESRISLVLSSEAAAFLAWLSRVHFTGAFNGCSTGAVLLKDIVSWIESATGRKAEVQKHADDDAFSLFWGARESYTQCIQSSSLRISFLPHDELAVRPDPVGSAFGGVTLWQAV